MIHVLEGSTGASGMEFRGSTPGGVRIVAATGNGVFTAAVYVGEEPPSELERHLTNPLPFSGFDLADGDLRFSGIEHANSHVGPEVHLQPGTYDGVLFEVAEQWLRGKPAAMGRALSSLQRWSDRSRRVLAIGGELAMWCAGGLTVVAALSPIWRWRFPPWEDWLVPVALGVTGAAAAWTGRWLEGSAIGQAIALRKREMDRLYAPLVLILRRRSALE